MKMNKHYNELKASYLFVDIAHKVAAYQEAHPEKEIIRLGIGDVTQPLAKCVVQAMRDAAEEMGTKEGFHGYGPEQGYPFLKQAIQGYYAGRGTQLAEDEIFISDGAKSDLANLLGLHFLFALNFLQQHCGVQHILQRFARSDFIIHLRLAVRAWDFFHRLKG